MESAPRCGGDNSWLQTFTGRRVWPLDPRPEDLDIRDIAHSLSQQCRFAGHVREFYSVAQHSVRVSFIVPPELALCGLMHDSSEAYLVDVPRPIKHLLPQYKEAEERLMHVLAARFGFTWPMPEEVRRADDVLLMAEARALVSGPLEGWSLPNDAAEDACEVLGGSMGPRDAESLFLARFCSLSGGTTADFLHKFIDVVNGTNDQDRRDQVRPGR